MTQIKQGVVSVAYVCGVLVRRRNGTGIGMSVNEGRYKCLSPRGIYKRGMVGHIRRGKRNSGRVRVKSDERAVWIILACWRSTAIL